MFLVKRVFIFFGILTKKTKKKLCETLKVKMLIRQFKILDITGWENEETTTMTKKKLTKMNQIEHSVNIILYIN